MSSDESSTQSWESISPHQRVKISLVQAQIEYHAQLYLLASAGEVQSVKDTVQDSFQAIADLRGGKTLSWQGDGGAFMFLADDGAGFNNCCLAAIQMLEMMPAVNQDIQSSTGIEIAAEVRLSCDAGMATYGSDPSHTLGDFVIKLMRHERQVSAANRVTITGRIHRQLSPQFKSRFTNWKFSPELEISLYGTPPIKNDADLFNLQRSAPQPMSDEKLPQRGEIRPVEELAPTRPRPRGPTGWRKAAGAALLSIVLIGALIDLAVVHFSPPAVPAVAARNDPFPSDEWAVWRQRVRDKLSAGEVTQESLIDVLQTRPAAPNNPPAAVLRHDQAVADVLMGVEGVRAFLRKHLGIDEQFLGTGMSKPVSATDYGSASVHEYLVPNLEDDDSRVWMRKLKLESLDLEMKVKDLIGDDEAGDGKNRGLIKLIIAQVEKENKTTGIAPVIRFAILKEKKYSGRIGRNDADRVFASDLTEVWNLSVREAANRSGYTFREGDAFFVWVFVPRHREEVVPATWGEVLEHLPKWLK